MKDVSSPPPLLWAVLQEIGWRESGEEREREFRLDEDGRRQRGRLNLFTLRAERLAFQRGKRKRSARTFHPNFILTMYGRSAVSG